MIGGGGTDLIWNGWKCRCAKKKMFSLAVTIRSRTDHRTGINESQSDFRICIMKKFEIEIWWKSRRRFFLKSFSYFRVSFLNERNRSRKCAPLLSFIIILFLSSSSRWKHAISSRRFSAERKVWKVHKQLTTINDAPRVHGKSCTVVICFCVQAEIWKIHTIAALLFSDTNLRKETDWAKRQAQNDDDGGGKLA